MTSRRRREFLLAASGAVAALSGCVSTGFPGSGGDADVTVYVGSYHWGFVLLDETGTERDEWTFDRDTVVDIVAFNTSAETALEALPSAVREGVPDHETLEARNENRIPAPTTGDFHDALEDANKRYPDHSLAVMPSGRNMGGGMGGMMLHPIPLPADATTPTTARLRASERGDYTLSCLTDCGYGHPYMERDGALVVR
jgi:hypothetical protein